MQTWLMFSTQTSALFVREVKKITPKRASRNHEFPFADQAWRTVGSWQQGGRVKNASHIFCKFVHRYDSLSSRKMGNIRSVPAWSIAKLNQAHQDSAKKSDIHNLLEFFTWKPVNVQLIKRKLLG